MRVRGIALAATALATVALLAACGSSDDGGKTSGGDATGSAAPPASDAPVGVRAKACGKAAAVGGEVRVTGTSCAKGRRVAAAWSGTRRCSPPGTSRTSCKVAGLTCLGAVTDRGLAVTCAAPGRSVVFIGRR